MACIEVMSACIEATSALYRGRVGTACQPSLPLCPFDASMYRGRVGTACQPSLPFVSMKLGQHAVLTLPETDGIPVPLYRGNVFVHRLSLACIEVGLALRANLAGLSAVSMPLGQHAVLTLPKADATRSARRADPTQGRWADPTKKPREVPGLRLSLSTALTWLPRRSCACGGGWRRGPRRGRRGSCRRWTAQGSRSGRWRR